MTAETGPARAPMAPLKFLAVVLLALAAVAAVATAGIVAYGRDALWAEMFGAPDLGPYDFDKPTRTGKLNDALACPAAAGTCLAARVDRLTPVFAVDGRALFEEARRLVEAIPGTTTVDDQADRLVLRVVVRTGLMHFPDTLSLRVREEGPGRSTLWLYSRSQVGYADLGENERRLRQVIRALRRTLPFEPPVG